MFYLWSRSINVFLYGNTQRFGLSLAVGVLLAVLSWYACFMHSRLWNIRFHLKLLHHLLCAIAAFITLLFSVLYPSLAYVGEAGVISITSWENAIKLDTVWADATFRKAYEAVKKLGVEDFSSVPQPGLPGSHIPVNQEKSLQEAALTYASSACTHFSQSRPFLGAVVWARPTIPAGVVLEDSQRWLQHDHIYPPDRAIMLVVRQIRISLFEQVHRLVIISRVLAIFIFLLTQAVPFGLIGWAAWREI